MDWARMLAYITGTVDQELLLRNEYLATENPCGQETRPHSRGELGMAGKHRGGARGAEVFGSTPTHRGCGQFVTSREKARPR